MNKTKNFYKYRQCSNLDFSTLFALQTSFALHSRSLININKFRVDVSSSTKYHSFRLDINLRTRSTSSGRKICTIFHFVSRPRVSVALQGSDVVFPATYSAIPLTHLLTGLFYFSDVGTMYKPRSRHV